MPRSHINRRCIHEITPIFILSASNCISTPWLVPQLQFERLIRGIVPPTQKSEPIETSLACTHNCKNRRKQQRTQSNKEDDFFSPDFLSVSVFFPPWNHSHKLLLLLSCISCVCARAKETCSLFFFLCCCVRINSSVLQLLRARSFSCLRLSTRTHTHSREENNWSGKRRHL